MIENTMHSEPVFADHCDRCGKWYLDCRWMTDISAGDELVACAVCQAVDRNLFPVEPDHRPLKV